MSQEPLPHPARILFVHSSDELYGSDAVLLELVRRLDRTRFTPLVALPTDLPYSGGLSTELACLGVHCQHLDMAVLRRRYLSAYGLPRFLWRLVRGSRQLGRLIQCEGVDLVHCNTAAVWSGALAAKLSGCPLIWHIHEIITHPPLMRKVIAWLVTLLADSVVTISGAVRDHLLADRPTAAAKIVVIPDAVDTHRFHPQVDGTLLRQELGLGADDVLVGCVGRLHTWKGQDLLVEAARHVVAQMPNVHFAIVGDIVPGQPKPRQIVEQRIQRWNLGANVHLLGFRREMPQVMAALDILALPSTLPEPFGVVLLEAMAMAVPVVAAAHGGALEIVVDDETGLLVPPGDAKTLADAIGQLAISPAARWRMGAAGRRRAEANYRFDQHVAAFQELYDHRLSASAVSHY